MGLEALIMLVFLSFRPKLAPRLSQRRGLALAGTIIGYVTVALWVLGSIAFAVAGAYLRGQHGMDDMGMYRMGWMD